MQYAYRQNAQTQRPCKCEASACCTDTAVVAHNVNAASVHYPTTTEDVVYWADNMRSGDKHRMLHPTNL